MPPKLTPEREAEAVEVATSAAAKVIPVNGLYTFDTARAQAIAALAALRDAGFVILHADDLTVETNGTRRTQPRHRRWRFCGPWQDGNGPAYQEVQR